MDKWIPRSEEEYKKNLRGISFSNFFEPLLVSVAVFILGMLIISFGGFPRYNVAADLRPNKAIMAEFPYIAIITFLTFVFLFIKRRIKQKKVTLVCESCNDIKNADEVYDCICGGKYVDIRRMKCVELNTEVSSDQNETENKKPPLNT